MLFNSLEYVVLFLPISAIIFFLLKKINVTLSKAWICATSLYFYSFFTYQFLPLLLCSMAINYILIKYISNSRSKHSILISVSFNILSLAYFKYCNFFLYNIDTAFGLSSHHLDIIAPLAISFYTFQQISLSVSIYRKQVGIVSIIDYCSYILFFPKLISGPITDYYTISSQLNNKKSYLGKCLAPSIFIFSIGLFKKIVLASYFGAIADQGYSHIGTLGVIDAWVASLSYTLQLYFDFSGYTDMAIGSALLFGVALPINFNSPYRATDLQDFWRRWHITLSTWLRNFVYIPLGGNRMGEVRTYINLFLTFLIGGFWHGAGWNFLAWGALHGGGLVIHRLWSQRGFKIPSIIAWFITFNYINITWIFFRTNNLHDALAVVTKMLGISTNLYSDFMFKQPFADSFLYEPIQNGLYILTPCIFAILLCLISSNSNIILSMSKENKKGFGWNIAIPIVSALCICTAAAASLGGAAPGAFIYFNF